MVGEWIDVNDKMQSGYRYQIVAAPGESFEECFNPYFTPKEMLHLGVFEGKYLNDCRSEFPEDWYRNASLGDVPDVSHNFFGVKSRQPLSVWRQKGWIVGDDPRGWFQWYCRYYIGRRDILVDSWQIKRWRAFSRHAGQIKANCMPHDTSCRPRQRQGLLQWSYDPFI